MSTINRPEIIKYLSNYFAHGRIKIKRTLLDGHHQIFDNMLFTGKYTDHRIELVPYYYTCGLRLGMKLKRIDKLLLYVSACDEDYYIVDNGYCVPYRWLQIIADFCEEVVELKYRRPASFERDTLLKEGVSPFWADQIGNHMTDETFDLMVKQSFAPTEQFIFTINTDKWNASNGKVSPYTQEIFEKCNRFKSLTPIADETIPYRVAHSASPSIMIDTEEIHNYLWFMYSCGHIGFPRYKNECREISSSTRRTYMSSTNMNIEEFMCYYMALEKLDVSVTELEIMSDSSL